MKAFIQRLMISVLLTLVPGASAIANGQQTSIVEEKTSTPPREVDSQKNSDSGYGDLTDREKALLDRIERLERRLAELESRTAAKPAGELAQPASVTTAEVRPNTASPIFGAAPASRRSTASSAPSPDIAGAGTA